MADQKWYDEGLRPRVFINWDTFEQQGLPSSWKGPFTDAVINAYTRWMNIGGVDLRFQFWGYTTKTSADNGELLIKMNERHVNSGRIASTFGAYNKLEIVFHRKRGSDLTLWNFVPDNPATGEIGMQGILMHELGHCLGLDHTAAAPTVMAGYNWWDRYAPFWSDVQDLRTVYSTYGGNRLRQMRTTDGGGSWTAADNELTSSNSQSARTNLPVGVAATPGSGLYVVGWSRQSNVPTWIRVDGSSGVFRPWFFYGGERSVHGPAYATDNNDTMLWAWVDNDAAGTLRIVRSTIDGFQWGWAGAPTGATTAGTPALCWTRVNGQSTWILVWSHFDRGDLDGTGRVRASISTNDGATWSTPAVVSDFYRANGGVAAAADADNHVVVAFSWAPRTLWRSRRQQIRTFHCEVDGGELALRTTIQSSETSRVQPALAFDRGANAFIMCWRGQDFNTSLNSMRKPFDASSWTTKRTLSARSHVAPALAYSPEHRETVVWYADDTA